MFYLSRNSSRTGFRLHLPPYCVVSHQIAGNGKAVVSIDSDDGAQKCREAIARTIRNDLDEIRLGRDEEPALEGWARALVDATVPGDRWAVLRAMTASLCEAIKDGDEIAEATATEIVGFFREALEKSRELAGA